MQPKSLGRGLESLLGKGRPEPRPTASLPLAAIQPGPAQPRSKVRPEQLAELAQSIKASGVIQPIIVRPVGGAAAPYEIVAGQRRWEAAQLAGCTDIPVVIRDLSDRDAVSVALIENIQREDLTPTEEARALARLAREFSLTHAEVADAVGRSRAAVSNLLRLLDLPADVLQLIEDRALGMGHARALLGLSGAADQIRVARQVVAQGLSVRATEALVRLALNPPAPQGEAPTVSEVLRAANVHVKLHQAQNGAGRLSVTFPDIVTRDAIIAALKQLLQT